MRDAEFEKYKAGAEQRRHVRAFIDELINKLHDFPGRRDMAERDTDGTTNFVTVYLTTELDIVDWLKGMKPDAGALHVIKEGEDEWWIAHCDDHGEVARGPMTVPGHDTAVVDWYIHEGHYHGGDGFVDLGLLIGQDKRAIEIIRDGEIVLVDTTEPV